FIYDQVDHLRHEDCGPEAIKHVLAKDNESCVVELQFDGKNQDGSKYLSSELKTKTNFANDNTRDVVSALQDDRIILRHADIIRFLDETKGNKRTAIAQIIGYEEITQFRSVIQQTRNALQKEGDYTGAKQLSESLQGEMIKSVGQVVPDRTNFVAIAAKIVAPLGVKTAISDETSYNNALTELRGVGNSAEKIKIVEQLTQLQKACDALVGDIEGLNSNAAAFSETYNALVQARDSVDKLRLSDFLDKGKAVISDSSYGDNACPFCLSPYDLVKLQTEVATRLSKMVELQGKLDGAKALKDCLLDTVRSVGTTVKGLGDSFKDVKEFGTLLASAANALKQLRDYYKTIDAAFGALAIFVPADEFQSAMSALRVQCEAGSKQANEAASRLNLTEHEKQVSDALGKLQMLDHLVNEYVKAQHKIDAYEAQILTLSSVFERFIPVQNAAIQAVLDRISEDVGAFYSKLHPKESVDKVRLAMVGEEGVEFEYHFHGKLTQPPQKYLSESHLNSLGIALFLANARIFNKQARFLVLDDIVTSFDTSHRRRLLRLLRDEFAEWQIIILTHESIWFELIKKEMPQDGWLFHELRSDPENGILLDESPATLKAIIEKKKGKEDVSNDLRKLLESVLKDICYALEVKVAFRFNDDNERRMIEELMGRLRATLNEKSPDLAKDKIFSDLGGSALIANLDSHDNPVRIAGSDVDVLLEDIEKLISLFVCATCNRPIQAGDKVPGSKEISCKCGKSKMPWKS
ncbi:MAG: hypothetical protein K8F25_01495, partial [Fimbriimonadaceae bacterium]|nr:hypothetical protein [Alphaproteobacteria bacterium]